MQPGRLALRLYRGASLISTRPPPGPYKRAMPPRVPTQGLCGTLQKGCRGIWALRAPTEASSSGVLRSQPPTPRRAHPGSSPPDTSPHNRRPPSLLHDFFAAVLHISANTPPATETHGAPPRGTRNCLGLLYCCAAHSNTHKPTPSPPPPVSSLSTSYCTMAEAVADSLQKGGARGQCSDRKKKRRGHHSNSTTLRREGLAFRFRLWEGYQ